MTRKILFIIFWVTLFSASAQTITIIDTKTKEPLPDVIISSLRPNKIVSTNDKGMADISSFKNSKKIEIRKLGYQTERTTYDEIEAKNFILAIQTLHFNLDEVVISATHWQQASNRVPQKIVRITQKENELQNPQTTADLLNLSGKVFIQKSQLGGGSPMIRGFATNRLLYSVDGVRMNTAIFRSGNLQNVISLDPLAIQNTEVLFGSGSVIYGSDAIGGVMSFQTLKPQLSLTDKTLIKGNSLTRFSTANKEKTFHFDLNIGWKKWALLTSFSTFNYDDLRQGAHGTNDYLKKQNVIPLGNGIDRVVKNKNELIQSPTAYSQMNFMQKVLYTPTNNWEISFNTHYSQTSPYGRYDRHLREKKGVPKYAEWDYGSQKWRMNLLEIKHKKSNLLYDQLSTRLAFQQFEESRIVRKLNNKNRETNTENVDAYSMNFDFEKIFLQKNTLYYGAQWVKNRVYSKGKAKNILTDSTWNVASRYPQSDWISSGIYADVLLRLSHRWSVQTGARYSRYQINGTFDKPTLKEYQFPFDKISLKNDALTGSLGAIYRLDNHFVFSSNLSTGFRSPNVDDMGKIFDSAKGVVVVPNPNLKAEYATNLDIGFVKIFSKKVKVDVTAYYTHLKDALVRDNYQLNGMDSIVYKGEKSKVEALQNRGKMRVYGVQLGTEIKLPYHLVFSTDLNFQKGVEFASNGKTYPARHTAPFFGNSKLTYKRKNVLIQLYANYQGELKNEKFARSEQKKREIYALDKNGNVYAPRWCTFNAKAHYQFSKNLSFSTGIENITDLRYRPYSSGISSAGRNFIFSLKLKH